MCINYIDNIMNNIDKINELISAYETKNHRKLKAAFNKIHPSKPTQSEEYLFFHSVAGDQINKPNILNIKFIAACMLNDNELMMEYIEAGATEWNQSLNYACRNNNHDKVKLFIEKIKLTDKIGRKIEIELGSTRYFSIGLATGLEGACYSDNITSAKMIIEACDEDFWTDLDIESFLGVACVEKRIEIVKLILEYEKKYSDNSSEEYYFFWDNVYSCACEGGDKDIINLIVDRAKQATNKDVDINGGLSGACAGGHIELINQMILEGATDWNSALLFACGGGHQQIVQLLIEKGATNINDGFVVACKEGHTNIAKFLIEKGATNWIQAIRKAYGNLHDDLVDVIIKIASEHATNPLVLSEEKRNELYGENYYECSGTDE